VLFLAHNHPLFLPFNQRVFLLFNRLPFLHPNPLRFLPINPVLFLRVASLLNQHWYQPHFRQLNQLHCQQFSPPVFLPFNQVIVPPLNQHPFLLFSLPVNPLFDQVLFLRFNQLLFLPVVRLFNQHWYQRRFHQPNQLHCQQFSPPLFLPFDLPIVPPVNQLLGPRINHLLHLLPFLRRFRLINPPLCRLVALLLYQLLNPQITHPLYLLPILRLSHLICHPLNLSAFLRVHHQLDLLHNHFVTLLLYQLLDHPLHLPLDRVLVLLLHLPPAHLLNLVLSHPTSLPPFPLISPFPVPQEFQPVNQVDLPLFLLPGVPLRRQQGFRVSLQLNLAFSMFPYKPSIPMTDLL
jgi:hypothetical protein